MAPEEGVGLVKVDVEGMELEVLSGAKTLLMHQAPHLIIESETSESLKHITTFLAPYGYKRISEWNATPTYYFAYKPTFGVYIKSVFLKLCHRCKLF